jgi:ammonium transporter, Amt family
LVCAPFPKEVALKVLLCSVAVTVSLLVAANVVQAAEPEVSAASAEKPPEPPKIDSGDTAWMLVSTGLVLLMVPGLALFYGGMVRRKNVLGTMMHSMVALAIIGIQWLLFGYSLAFGLSQGGYIGWSWDYVGLHNTLVQINGNWYHQTFPGTSIPIFVHCMYQGMFAIITPALISGAIAERIKFGPYCLFILLWAVLVYDPLAHWVWAVDAKGTPVGWLGAKGALDFAGGTVVHIAAGLSGLAAILVLRRRIGYPAHAMHPNSMVLTLIGAGLLWFGWFGFNGGSALASNGLAGSALAASQVAAAAAALSWMIAEWIHKGKPTALGLASGLVAGLVAVTPASGFVTPLAALIIGSAAGVVCYAMVCLKPFFKYDDSLDAFGVHGVGGFLGAILTGVFANALLYKAGSGSDIPSKLMLDGDRMGQIGVQLTAAGVAVAYSFVVTLVLVKVIDLLFGFTLEPRAEGDGLDHSQHGEVGFDLGLALETIDPEMAAQEPRAATVPPNGHTRFTVVVEGANNGDLMHAWSNLCQAGSPPPPRFKSIYPYMTTVSGNRFRFRGGDSKQMSENLRLLFAEQLEKPALRAHVEN